MSTATTNYGDINTVLKEARANRLRRSLGEARTFIYGPHAISVKEFKELNDRSSVSDIEEKLTEHIYRQASAEKAAPVTMDKKRWGTRFSFEEKNVVQLGSGIGLAGIFLQLYVPTSKVSIAESEELLPLVTENVQSNGLVKDVSVHRLELNEDLQQQHIRIRAYDYVFAVLDIYNSPEMTEKLFQVILELSGNGSLLLFAYKRYLKLDERSLKRKMTVNDFQNREEEFRAELGKFFQLRSSFQTIYKVGSSAEIVVTEITRTPFSTFLQS